MSFLLKPMASKMPKSLENFVKRNKDSFVEMKMDLSTEDQIDSVCKVMASQITWPLVERLPEAQERRFGFLLKSLNAHIVSVLVTVLQTGYTFHFRIFEGLIRIEDTSFMGRACQAFCYQDGSQIVISMADPQDIITYISPEEITEDWTLFLPNIKPYLIMQAAQMMVWDAYRKRLDWTAEEQ